MVGFTAYAFTIDSSSESITTQIAILCFCGLRFVPSLQKCAVSLMQIGLSNRALYDLCSLFDSKVSPTYKTTLNHNQIEEIIIQKQDFAIDFAKIKYEIENEIHIKNGRVTFVTGESGVGKSLFLKALITYKDEVSHDVIITNSNNNYKIPDFNIGYVSQKSVLFDSSIGSNIVFKNNIDSIKQNIELIESLLFRVGLVQFTSKDSSGIFYDVGESGKKLSGGQKQKLLIARSLFTNPDILILDEVTSGLDLKSCSNIYSIIHEISNTIPVIVISHNIDKYSFSYDQIKIDVKDNLRIISKAL
jgi:ABC-type bacteriocin/lantibiotic exporter with double-glycine peptidase domain